MTGSNQHREPQPPNEDCVYKVLRRDEIVHLIRDGRFEGSQDDLRDGFVHLSAAPQVHGTLVRHFADKSGLFLAICYADGLGAALRWEASRHGEAFPHLYRPLYLADIAALVPIPDAREGWSVPGPPAA